MGNIISGGSLLIPRGASRVGPFQRKPDCIANSPHLPLHSGPMTAEKRMKTVIITGGATGIGLETAKALVASGDYRVAILGRRPAILEAAAAELGGSSQTVSIHTCDLRDEKQIRNTVEKIAGAYKGIYGVVNNAGVYPFGETHNTESTAWDDTFAINLKAPFLLTQAVLPTMSRSGGRIVNISSTAGILPNHFALAYSVSKAGLIHLTKTMAKELGRHNITVNCVCPGIVRTPLHDAYHSNTTQMEEFYARRGAAYPLGRVGEPTDVATAVKFFLSEDAAWITGDVMVIDGGRLLV